MKRIILGIMAVFLLSGCSVGREFRETVYDTIDAKGHWTEASYEILFGVPEGARCVSEMETEKCFLTEDGNLEIKSVRMLADGIDFASMQLTGGADYLEVVETTRFSLPQYSVCWWDENAEQRRYCRADIVIDDIYAYALVCSVPENAGTSLDGEVQKILNSFGIFYNEGV